MVEGFSGDRFKHFVGFIFRDDSFIHAVIDSRSYRQKPTTARKKNDGRDS